MKGCFCSLPPQQDLYIGSADDGFYFESPFPISDPCQLSPGMEADVQCKLRGSEEMRGARTERSRRGREIKDEREYLKVVGQGEGK